MFYYTYVLKSQKEGRLYIGSTYDPNVRVPAHNRGSVASTKHRRPFVLVYFEACLDKNKASKRERYFKTGFGREFLKKRI